MTVMPVSGMTHLAAEAIGVYWGESNRRGQLTLQLQHVVTVSGRDAFPRVAVSPGLMQWVLLGIFIGCYLVSRTDSTIGLLFRTFSSFMFP